MEVIDRVLHGSECVDFRASNGYEVAAYRLRSGRYLVEAEGTLGGSILRVYYICPTMEDAVACCHDGYSPGGRARYVSRLGAIKEAKLESLEAGG